MLYEPFSAMINIFRVIKASLKAALARTSRRRGCNGRPDNQSPPYPSADWPIRTAGAWRAAPDRGRA